MRQEDVKYVYTIDFTLSIGKVLDSLTKELNLKEGVLRYFSFSKDDLIKETLPSDKLKERVLEIHPGNEDITIVFTDVEINTSEEEIEIVSKIKLKLEGIEDVIEKSNKPKIL